MDRYTRKDAEHYFERLIAAIGGRIAQDYKDIGAYRLDWNGTYGGGVIEKIVNEGGAVSQPFGRMRRNAKEFVACVGFAIDAIEVKGRNSQITAMKEYVEAKS